MNGPRLVVDEATFRIVRTESGNNVTYVMEMPDGADALGVERWKDIVVNGKPAQALFSYVIKQAMKGQTDAENE